ncbi:DUF4123 domain-containing protein [Luteimonas sp. A501]
MSFANKMPSAPQIAGMAASLCCTSSIRLWALADFALLTPDAVAALRQDGAANALSGSALAAFGEHAPHLIELPSADPSHIGERVAKLVRRSGDASAISVLQTDAGLSELRSLAAYLSRVRIEGNPRPVHCRFADTRVLPHVLEVLSTTQRRRVGAVVQQWHWFNRLGVPESVSFDTGNSQSPDPESFLHFDISQFRAVRRKAEADAIFKLLLEQTPSLVPASDRGHFYQDLTGVLDTADGYGVEQLDDRLQFVVLSLSCGRDFHRLACLDETWNAIKDGNARLATRMTDWDDAMWQQLEHRSGAAA